MTLNLVPTERSCHKVYHVKYEGPDSYQSKDMANVKDFADQQTDRPTDKWTGQKLSVPDLLIRGHTIRIIIILTLHQMTVFWTGPNPKHLQTTY